MCPDALLLLLKVFCGFFVFFLTPQPGLTTAHSNYGSYRAKWVRWFSCTEPKQQVCDCVWWAGKQRSLLEITAAQGALPGFPQQLLVQRKSCLEEPVQQGLLCTSGEQGERRSLCKQTGELGSCFWRARNTSQGISFSRGAVQFLGSLAWRLNPTWTDPLHAAEGIPLTF